MVVVGVNPQLLTYPIQYVRYTHLAVIAVTDPLLRAVNATLAPLACAVTALTEACVLAVIATVAITFASLSHTQAC
jgi:hypothetical protein